MFSRLRASLTVPIAVLLVACASSMPKIDSSPATLASIKTIAVVRAPEPKSYSVVYLGHPAAIAFGAIGGIAAAADQQGKEDRLSQLYKGQNVAVMSTLADKVAANLRQLGYRATVVDGPWEDVNGKPTLAFEKIKSDADAVLVLTPLMVGFFAMGTGSDYLPTVQSAATLLGKERKEQLYKGFIASGWHPSVDGWKSRAPKTMFKNFDALVADPKTSAQSLDAAAADVASLISLDLRR